MTWCLFNPWNCRVLQFHVYCEWWANHWYIYVSTAVSSITHTQCESLYSLSIVHWPLSCCCDSMLDNSRKRVCFFFSYIQRDMDCQDRKGSGSSRNLAVHIFINMQRMQGRRKGKEEKRKGEGRKEEVKKEKSRNDKGEKRRVGEWEETRKRGELGLGQGYVCSEPTLMTYFLQQDTTSAVPPTRD